MKFRSLVLKGAKLTLFGGRPGNDIFLQKKLSSGLEIQLFLKKKKKDTLKTTASSPNLKRNAGTEQLSWNFAAPALDVHNSDKADDYSSRLSQ